MKSLEEIQQIERVVEDLDDYCRSEVICRVQGEKFDFPVYKISFGNPSPQAPVLGIVGGVHGLERIGAQVSVSLLQTFSKLALWDQTTKDLLKEIRVFFIPTVNPYGLAFMRRSNHRGVDLMRNAPIEGDGKIPFLLGGHYHSPLLPWYRGRPEAMELEAQALCENVRQEIAASPCAITVDFHSGFGLRDRIWFPYANSTKVFEDIELVHSLVQLLENTYPHHFYQIEPQSMNYTTHGDLWDYIFQEHRKQSSQVFVPLCVEMGSWNWVKKNPFQIFSSLGPFNPVKAHRMKRTLRRHNTFFDFLLKALRSPKVWSTLSEEQKFKHRQLALGRWYKGTPP